MISVTGVVRIGDPRRAAVFGALDRDRRRCASASDGSGVAISMRRDRERARSSAAATGASSVRAAAGGERRCRCAAWRSPAALATALFAFALLSVRCIAVALDRRAPRRRDCRALRSIAREVLVAVRRRGARRRSASGLAGGVAPAAAARPASVAGWRRRAVCGCSRHHHPQRHCGDAGRNRRQPPLPQGQVPARLRCCRPRCTGTLRASAPTSAWHRAQVETCASAPPSRRDRDRRPSTRRAFPRRDSAPRSAACRRLRSSCFSACSRMRSRSRLMTRSVGFRAIVASVIERSASDFLRASPARRAAREPLVEVEVAGVIDDRLQSTRRSRRSRNRARRATAARRPRGSPCACCASCRDTVASCSRVSVPICASVISCA